MLISKITNFSDILLRLIQSIFLAFNINKLKRELKLEDRMLKEFYIRMQSDLSYSQIDNFNNYEIYTFVEGYIHYDFDEFGNLKNGNIIQ